MTAVICGGIIAAGLANVQERAGLWLLELSEARRRREAAAAGQNDARWRRWAERRLEAAR